MEKIKPTDSIRGTTLQTIAAIDEGGGWLFELRFRRRPSFRSAMFARVIVCCCEAVISIRLS
jgi:hypothetical protein